MILFTGGCLPQCMLGCHTPSQEQTPPPGADTPQRQTPPWRHTPWSIHTPQEQMPPRADTPPGADPPGADTPWKQHPLEAATPLPPTKHAGRYSQHVGSMHRTGIQSCYYGSSNLSVATSHNAPPYPHPLSKSKVFSILCSFLEILAKLWPSPGLAPPLIGKSGSSSAFNVTCVLSSHLCENTLFKLETPFVPQICHFKPNTLKDTYCSF